MGWGRGGRGLTLAIDHLYAPQRMKMKNGSKKGKSYQSSLLTFLGVCWPSVFFFQNKARLHFKIIENRIGSVEYNRADSQYF